MIDTSQRFYDSYEDAGIRPYRPYADPAGVDEWRMVCPACTPNRKPEHQREKDLVVNTRKQTWYCHHCEWSAGLHMNRGIRPASQRVEAQPAAALPPANKVQAEGYWGMTLLNRGLEPDDYREARFIEKFCPVCGRNRDVLAIPFVVDGFVVNHKYRCPDKHFWQDKGAAQVFFNLDNARDADPVIITEGELDVFACRAAGRPHAISVPNGAPPPDAKNLQRKFEFMASGEELLARASRIIIAVDNDPPGEALREELIRRIGADKCASVHWPEGCKDANDTLVTYGAAELKRCLDSAQPTPVKGIFTGDDLETEMLHYMQFGFDKGTPIGIPSLDEVYRPTLGHLTVVTGHAGSGKSTVIDNFVVQLLVRHGWPVAFFSPEQQPLARHQLALCEIYLRKPSVQRLMCNPNRVMTTDELRQANRFLSEYVSYIHPEGVEEEPSLDRILELATKEVYRRGIKVLVVDPWNEIEHARPKQYTETEYVSAVLSKLRRWGRSTGVHTFLIAHPRKMRTDDGKDAVPGLGDISGSNHFRNKADYGMSIHRDQQEAPNTVSVYINKARWRDSAIAPRRVVLEYDPVTNVVGERLPTIGDT